MQNIKIAIISDIHANSIALEEVLKDIDQRGITQIYCLGDLVDFAPWGNEVISLIRDREIPCILGNHDQRIAFDSPIIPLSHHHAIETKNRDLAINLSKNQITKENKKWLSKLPLHRELTFKFDGKHRRIVLFHASPVSNDQYVYRSDLKHEMFDPFKKEKIDALVMGHTHLSYTHVDSGVLFVNCGSVGRSREKDRKATYCILDISKSQVSAEIIKLNYDIAKVSAAIYNSSIPDFYGDFLLDE